MAEDLIQSPVRPPSRPCLDMPACATPWNCLSICSPSPCADGTTADDAYKVLGAMITELDYGVGNVTAALKAAGRPWLMLFNADNGGPINLGNTNAPLRRDRPALHGHVATAHRKPRTWLVAPGRFTLFNFHLFAFAATARCPSPFCNAGGGKHTFWDGGIR